MLSLLLFHAISLLPSGMPFCAPYIPYHREAQGAAIVAIVNYDPSPKVQNDKEIVFLVQKLLKAPVSHQQLKKISRPIPDGWSAIDSKKYLVFADIEANKADPFHIVEYSDEIESYMAGLLKCSDTQALIRFVFPYLKSSESEVARDSYWTIKQQPDKELLAARSDFDVDKLRTWLNAKSDDYRKTELFACLLGYCGSSSDIPLLKKLLERHSNQQQSIEEILFAITQLNPIEGWAIAARFSGMTGSGTFSVNRFPVYRLLCRTYEIDRAKPDEKTLHRILDQGLSQIDFADLTVNFIRKSKLWGYTPRVLNLYKDRLETSILNRAIIRLALQSPDPAAAPFLTRLRKDNPEAVKDCEEIIELEK